MPASSGNGSLSEKPLLHMTTRDATGLVAVLKLIGKEYQDFVRIEAWQGSDAQPAGLQIRSIDPGKSSFLEAFFPVDDAVRCGESAAITFRTLDRECVSLWIKPLTLAKVLSASVKGLKTGGYLQHLRVGQDVARVTVESAAGGTVILKEHTVSLLSPDSSDDSVVDAERFEFTVEALFDSPTLLQDILAELKACECEDVVVSARPEPPELRFHGDGRTSCCTVDVKIRTHGVAGSSLSSGGKGGISSGPVSLEVEADFQSSFNVKHLLKVLQLCKQSSSIMLQMGQDAPLSVIFSLKGGSTVQVFVAPLIDEDGDPATAGELGQA